MNANTVAIREYGIVTAAYWGFTVTDGALRMLVLLHFHALGFAPLSLAFLFLLYELVGMITNLAGGWMGARHGLRVTLLTGLGLQIVALVALSAVQMSWGIMLSIAYVMGCQALSGIAKDLTKMSSKSAVKLLVRPDSNKTHETTLFKWVAFLTGSKNALKGIGFFVGGLGLSLLGFVPTLWTMAGALVLLLLFCVVYLTTDLGQSSKKPRLATLLSKSRRINDLSVARLFLFASRDVWFVVALPVFLTSQLDWTYTQVGTFMALWVIGYGIVQTVAPRLIYQSMDVRAACTWAMYLLIVCACMALLLSFGIYPTTTILFGLALFAIVFAVNSSLHSYLILAYTNDNDVALDVGFYYMANAAGRLLGTLLSGLVYMVGGLQLCLWMSAALIALATIVSLRLPRSEKPQHA